MARSAVLGALTTSLLLAATAPAVALAGEPGGTAAPASSAAGGSQFGVPSSQSRPIVSQLTVPSSVAPGRPPRVTMRIEEKGGGSVDVVVDITNLATRHVAAQARMGWVHTRRTLTIPWPSSARLTSGSYHVSVSAHDRHGANLLRSAHTSGVATLVVRTPAAAKPLAEPQPTPAPEAGVPTPAQTVADGAIFPVQGPHNFGGPENRFGAPREGHIHQGQDVLTSEGTQVVVPLAGTIESTSYQAGGAGYYAVEHTAIGFDFMFAHCEANSFSVTSGESVQAGAPLCKAGQTGDATTPHLHFEMWVGGWQAPGGHPIDPLPYLEAWEAAAAS
jgi:hypothetical protein